MFLVKFSKSHLLFYVLFICYVEKGFHNSIYLSIYLSMKCKTKGDFFFPLRKKRRKNMSSGKFQKISNFLNCSHIFQDTIVRDFNINLNDLISPKTF